MNRILLGTVAALALSASIAAATPLTDSIVAGFQAQGYSNIQIETGRTQIRVEAVRAGRKVEVIYDAATGAILHQEFDDYDGDDGTR